VHRNQSVATVMYVLATRVSVRAFSSAMDLWHTPNGVEYDGVCLRLIDPGAFLSTTVDGTSQAGIVQCSVLVR
jgi:hypothetical protein